MKKENNSDLAAETEIKENSTVVENSELQEMENRYLRLQADYDNFRRRTKEEYSNLSIVVRNEILERILPILDIFELALARAPVDEKEASYQEGLNLIYRQLVNLLENYKVSVIEAVGQKFDPMYHEAVMRVASTDYEEDEIINVLQKGYMLEGKVLRPAKVQVAFCE